MIQYRLYVESGPKRRKTMVHVLDLLGCIAQGPTTKAALQATPEAIRSFLGFLKQHGEKVDPKEAFTVAVAEHVTEGVWLGYGDPTPGFSPDFQTLSAKDLDTCLRRLAWLREDLAKVVQGLTVKQLAAKPQGSGRAIGEILQHVAESQTAYVGGLVGKVDGLPEALKAVRNSQESPCSCADSIVADFQRETCCTDGS